MSKSKSKRKRPVVRGPQRALNLEPKRTARLRYVEPPTKKDGQPFFALRVRSELLRAFKAKAKADGKEATAMVRAYMVRVTGVSSVEEGADA